MALSWGYKANGAVPVLVVVPMNQVHHQAAHMQDVLKRLEWSLRAAL